MTNDLEEFYQQFDKVKQQCKMHKFTVVMGDFNAKVGDGVEIIVCLFGLGERNERRDRLVEWCVENN